MRCPKCNALNSKGASWCGQCFHKFQTEDSIDHRNEQPASSATTLEHERKPASTNPGDAAGPQMLKKGDKAVWTCPKCDSENSLELSACGVCGSNLFDFFREEGPAVREDRNPNLAAILSLVPGAGHFYIGLKTGGAVRLLLAVWWTAMGVLLISLPGTIRATGGLVFLAVGGLVILSAADAFRMADDPSADPLLNRRVVLWASMGILGLVFMALFMGLFQVKQ